MRKRFAAIALVGVALSTSAIAQGTSGGGAGGRSSGGAPAGAPGSSPSGTAGTPSTASPAIGTPGVPGPSTGAGMPGGPGPGAPATPNLTPPPVSAPRAGSAGNIGSAAPAASTTSGQGASQPGPSRTPSRAHSPAGAQFNPGAVIDTSLDRASLDITEMSASELRALVSMFDRCTFNQHPWDREGACGAASKRYKQTFGKDRAIDRAITELERIVRFQKMFRGTGASTEYEDRINKRLRGAAALALAFHQQGTRVGLEK